MTANSRLYHSTTIQHFLDIHVQRIYWNAVATLDSSNMLQNSMDGPSTNWKFLDQLIKARKDSNSDLPDLLNVGSCSLHIVHGAFKTGTQSTGWNLDNVLKRLYRFLKVVPARAEDYKAISGTDILPLRFCSTRWLEDGMPA